jgi:hypothetical protein
LFFFILFSFIFFFFFPFFKMQTRNLLRSFTLSNKPYYKMQLHPQVKVFEPTSAFVLACDKVQVALANSSIPCIVGDHQTLYDNKTNLFIDVKTGYPVPTMEPALGKTVIKLRRMLEGVEFGDDEELPQKWAANSLNARQVVGDFLICRKPNQTVTLPSWDIIMVTCGTMDVHVLSNKYSDKPMVVTLNQGGYLLLKNTTETHFGFKVVPREGPGDGSMLLFLFDQS